MGFLFCCGFGERYRMAKEFSESLYRSKAWKRVREYCLMRDNYLCQICGKPAEEVHHKIHLTPRNVHDMQVALDPDNLISLCRDCHFTQHKRDIAARARRARSRARVLREDGCYFDQNGMIQMRKTYLVYGSPRSGKTTYVRNHMEDGDCVVDFDAIVSALQLSNQRKPWNNLRYLAMDIKDYLIEELEKQNPNFDCKNVWLIGGYPTRKERRELCERLGAEPIYIDTPQKICEERAAALNSYGDVDYALEIVRDWWEKYQP